MTVSIITPTHQRNHYLLLLYQVLLQQDYLDWEWLILDTSPQPSLVFLNHKDTRIRYQHVLDDLTIGAKRNHLVSQAQGKWIVQCDDDDYYAPGYLKAVVERLKEADFFTLTSWFCYETINKEFFYWDTTKIDQHHFMLSPLHPGNSQEINLRELWNENEQHAFMQNCQQGYGFSYAYHKKVIEKCAFENRNFGEDFAFYNAVKDQGFKIMLEQDRVGLVMHRMHETNTAQVFPQFKIPHFMAQYFFPQFHHD